MLFAVGLLYGCKSSTDSVQGQKLQLITFDQDTLSAESGSVEFTVTAVDGRNAVCISAAKKIKLSSRGGTCGRK